MTVLEINVVVERFRTFLNDNLDEISAVLDYDSINDWIQSNWELLVESKICKCNLQFLEVYGDGADCNEDSSRVWSPESLPTHKLVCFVIAEAIDQLTGQPVSRSINRKEHLDFEAFCSWDESKHKYDFRTPLDHVMCNLGDDIIIVRVNEIKFGLEAIRQEQ